MLEIIPVGSNVVSGAIVGLVFGSNVVSGAMVGLFFGSNVVSGAMVGIFSELRIKVFLRSFFLYKSFDIIACKLIF